MLKLNHNQALVISANGQKIHILTANGKQYKTTKRNKIPPLVAGDIVILQKTIVGNMVITKLLNRVNSISRNNKSVAANIDYLILVIALSPKYQLELIDRYLIIAEKKQIPIIIIINKIDLTTNIKQLKEKFAVYQQLGYKTYYTSIKNNIGINDILQDITNKTCLIVGQSGVGKSSITNCIIPNINITTKELSKELGRHTTSATTLYSHNNITVIDSPGVRELSLDNITIQDASNGFVEFKSLAQKCKFRNCKHKNEPDCGVKQALKNNIISKYRYQNYINIINSI